MIEAEFHAVWKTPFGNLVDITPSFDHNAKQILFVIDKNKKFEGNRTDNFRFNTTNNELFDDMIAFEKAKFKLIDNAETVNSIGEVQFKETEQIKWEQVNIFSNIIDDMCRLNNTVQSKCFCDSGLTYEQCHRQILKQFLTSI